MLVRSDDDTWEPKIIDFGMARQLAHDDPGHHATRTGRVVGTPRYMPPEQITGQPVDARADLYALGLVLFEMLAGRPPFEGDSTMQLLYRHVHEPPPALVDLLPSGAVPPAFSDLVGRCLAKAPSDRPASAREIARSLEATQRGLRLTARSYETLDGSGPRLEAGPTSLLPMFAFVGRRLERATTQAALDTAIGPPGKGAVICIDGVRGIGKSRLARHLIERAQRLYAARLAQGHAGGERGGGLQIVRDAVSALLAQGTTEGRRLEESLVARWGSEASDVAAAIARFLRPQQSDRARTRAEEESALDVVFGAVCNALRLEARQEAVIVVLEDARADDTPLARFVAYVSARLKEDPARVCIVLARTLAARDIVAAPIDGVVPVRLGPLEAGDCEALVQACLLATPDLAAQIAAVSEGNPLHLLALVQHLHERGELSLGPDGWSLPEATPLGAVVPVELGDLIETRLDGFAARANAGPLALNVLARASLLGDRVRVETLEDALLREGANALLAALDDALNEAVHAALIEREALEHGLVVPTHALIRDVLRRRAALEPTYPQLCGCAADALRDASAREPEQTAFEIAVLLSRADRWADAAMQADLAARASLGASDVGGAERAVSLGEQALDRAHDAIDETTQRRLLAIGGEVRLLVGDWAGARARFETLAACDPEGFATPGLAEAREGAGRGAEGAGMLDDAASELASARYVYASLGHHRAEARVIELLARIATRRQHFDQAESLLRDARVLHERLGDEVGLAQTCAALGNVVRQRGRLDEAFEYLTTAVATLRATPEAVALGRALYDLGNVFLAREHQMDALDCFERGCAILTRAGHRRGAAACLGNCAIALTETNAIDLGAEKLERSLALQREIGEPMGIAQGILNLGDIRFRQGRFDEAVALSTEALQLYVALDDRAGQLVALGNLGQVALARGDVEASVSAYRDAVSCARATGLRTLQVDRAFRGLCDALIAAGRPDEASHARAEAEALSIARSDSGETALDQEIGEAGEGSARK